MKENTNRIRVKRVRSNRTKKRENKNTRERENTSKRERESVCVCVCVKAHSGKEEKDGRTKCSRERTTRHSAKKSSRREVHPKRGLRERESMRAIRDQGHWMCESVREPTKMKKKTPREIPVHTRLPLTRANSLSLL
jgi:hypothetical protein